MRIDLRRIGQPPPAGASVDTLRRLHLGHRETFLFENLPDDPFVFEAQPSPNLVPSYQRRVTKTAEEWRPKANAKQHILGVSVWTSVPQAAQTQARLVSTVASAAFMEAREFRTL